MSVATTASNVVPSVLTNMNMIPPSNRSGTIAPNTVLNKRAFSCDKSSSSTTQSGNHRALGNVRKGVVSSRTAFVVLARLSDGRLFGAVRMAVVSAIGWETDGQVLEMKAEIVDTG